LLRRANQFQTGSEIAEGAKRVSRFLLDREFQIPVQTPVTRLRNIA
jgi:hypothetical protein